MAAVRLAGVLALAVVASTAGAHAEPRHGLSVFGELEQEDEIAVQQRFNDITG